MKAQLSNCVFKEPTLNINFGNGMVSDLNTAQSYYYRRVGSSCPTDGHYAITSATRDCFRGDWQSLPEDHTPGDAEGNMMLVNASYATGTFLTTSIAGLKGGTNYEFSVWMMNVCRPTDKCPYPLLPNISIMLEAPDGKVLAQFGTGELARRETPQWTRYQALFTTPPSATDMTLVMINSSPGGCGNDFALDDISFRECIIPKPVVKTAPKTPVIAKKQPLVPGYPVAARQPVITPKQTAVAKQPPVVTKPPVAQTAEVPKQSVAAKQPPVITKQPLVTRQPPVIPKQPVAAKQPAPIPKQPPVAVKQTPVASKTPVKKETAPPVKTATQISEIAKLPADLPVDVKTVIKQKPPVFPPAPPAITSRANPLIKLIETEAADIKLDLYDNGEIDGDTVSVYHNNVLLVSHARLSQKAISFSIAIDPEHPHHELVMVAHNLGSIPPNTSLMVINVGTKRYEVYISSNEQKNAKVIFDLKE